MHGTPRPYRAARLWLSAVILTSLLLACPLAYADFSQAAEKMRDCVVTVTVAAEKRMGAGFIISADGTILTNKHVLDKATQATVRLANKDELPAVVLKEDPNRDLLALKVDRQRLPSVTFASSAKLKQGVEVAALGAPFGLSDTLTKGIVSSVSREIEGKKFLQIDAALNQGNSGGPIINEDGQVVGVATKAALKAENMGFAVPSDDVMAFLTEAGLTFATLDAPVTPAPVAGGPPAEGAPAAPAVPVSPPMPVPAAPAPPALPSWVMLAGAAVIAFVVALITALVVAKSVVRPAMAPPVQYAQPTYAAPSWGAAPTQPQAPLPATPPAPQPPADDLNDIDITLR